MSQKQYIFDGPKMFTPLRQSLAHHNLPASAIAAYILAHFVCDPDTGEFTRDDSEMARMSEIPRQTIWVGMNQLEHAGLITVSGSTCMIKDYEINRLHASSYFRIPTQFLKTAAKCVRHHLPDVILFGMQLLDQLRTDGAKPQYSKQSLRKHLGWMYYRAKRKLEFLSDTISFDMHQGVRGEVFTFKPVVAVLASEEQVKHRNARGAITRNLKEGLSYLNGRFTESRRFINTCVKFIQEFASARWIDEKEIHTLARVIGIQLADKRAQGDPVQYPRAYLRASIDDLVAQL